MIRSGNPQVLAIGAFETSGYHCEVIAASPFGPVPPRDNLHRSVTRILALRIIEADASTGPFTFPNEDELCIQLGVSRTVVRESMKVLADKGMVEMKPRAGTKALPRSRWRLLDPDILAWQSESRLDPAFLRHLCEVRLAIEPTAAGFAALRGTDEDFARIERCYRERKSRAKSLAQEEGIELDLEFHRAVVAASHNPLLDQLSATISAPLRAALAFTSKLPAAVELDLEAYSRLLEALHERDPLAARKASDEIVGLAMLAVEEAIRVQTVAERRNRTGARASGSAKRSVR